VMTPGRSTDGGNISGFVVPDMHRASHGYRLRPRAELRNGKWAPTDRQTGSESE
jgi:hypothetical protein